MISQATLRKGVAWMVIWAEPSHASHALPTGVHDEPDGGRAPLCCHDGRRALPRRSAEEADMAKGFDGFDRLLTVMGVMVRQCCW